MTMDIHILDRALHESIYDLDATIKTLRNLNLADQDNNNSNPTRVSSHHDTTTSEIQKMPQGDHQKPIVPDDIGSNTEDWVELFMGEMVSCSNMEDVRVKTADLLKGFEKSIRTGLEKENMVLKRAVCLLLRRRGELEEAGSREVSRLNEMVAYQQEQLRALEATNYGLTVHLNQALQSNNNFGDGGSFNSPDVF